MRTHSFRSPERSKRAPQEKRLSRDSVLLVLSEGVSSLGAMLTSFGLDIWVFKETGSYSIFAALAVIASLPGLMFAPIAGVIADRFAKQKLLLLCELVSLAAIFVSLAAALYDFLSVWLVGFTILVLSLSETVRWPVLSVSVSLLTPKDKLGNINGLLQMFQGIVMVSGPVLGALFFEMLGLVGMMAMDGVSYVISIVLLLMLKIDQHRNMDAVKEKNSSRTRRVIDEALFGFSWINRHGRLKRLLGFFVLFNTSAAVFSVTYTPYLLSFLSSDQLGISLALTGGGMVVGGALYMHWGGPKRKDLGVVGGAVIATACMVAWGVTRDQGLIYAIAFCYGAAVPIINASSQTIWQARVPLQIQGKVFAVRKMIAWGLNPVAVLMSIPLAELVFVPLTQFDDEVYVLNNIAEIWGVGLAGALGMMISVLGFVVLSITVVLILRGGLRMDKCYRTPQPNLDYKSNGNPNE